MSVDNSLEPNFKSPRANWVQVERLKKKNWCYCFLSAFYLYLVLKKLSFFPKLLISSPVVQFSWLLALLHYVVRPFFRANSTVWKMLSKPPLNILCTLLSVLRFWHRFCGSWSSNQIDGTSACDVSELLFFQELDLSLFKIFEFLERQLSMNRLLSSSTDIFKQQIIMKLLYSFSFWAFLPPARLDVGSQYCYYNPPWHTLEIFFKA